jgi:hypothetical protein
MRPPLLDLGLPVETVSEPLREAAKTFRASRSVRAPILTTMFTAWNGLMISVRAGRFPELRYLDPLKSRGFYGGI